MKILTSRLLVPLVISFFLYSCTSADLYEKTAHIPGFKWSSHYKPSFSFSISDTSRPYQIFLVLRHNDKYNYSNIYVNLYASLPGQDTVLKITRECQLADNEHGWALTGTGMDDIYEHRLKLGEPQQLKKGDYTFTLEQIMREDPLENVLDVGIRVEKLQ